MSYITEALLTREFQRLFDSKFPDWEGKGVARVDDRDNERANHPFTAVVGDNLIKFTIPEDVLHSAPLSIVSERYLQPILDRITKVSE